MVTSVREKKTKKEKKREMKKEKAKIFKIIKIASGFWLLVKYFETRRISHNAIRIENGLTYHIVLACIHKHCVAFSFLFHSFLAEMLQKIFKKNFIEYSQHTSHTTCMACNGKLLDILCCVHRDLSLCFLHRKKQTCTLS